MKKRFLAMVLAASMVFSLAACGGDSGGSQGGDSSAADSGSEGGSNTDSGSGDGAGSDEAGEPVKLVMAFRTSGSIPSEADIDRIEEAVNQITREKINAEIELLIIQNSSYVQQMTLMLSGSEQLDIMGATSPMMASTVGSEQIRDLGELLDTYGQGIKEVLGEDVLSCGRFEGTQYFIPPICDIVLGMGYYTMRKDIVDKYNIDLSQVKTYEDLTEVFQIVHDNEPNMNVVGTNGAGTSPMQYNVAWDKLGNYFGVLDDRGQGELKVVNLFETENYRKYVDTMHEWYTKGFISQDITNATESGAAQMKAGTLFAYCNSNKPGIDTQEAMNTGCEVVGCQVLDSILSTGNNWQWTIPENSVDPVKAMQFLNLLYTDADLLNIIVYGIEGTDYVMHEDGRIGYPEGIDATNVGYSLSPMLWSFGNEFNAHVWETNDPDVWEQTKEWNKTGVKSKAYGFVFNTAPVSNEIAAVQNVYDQYKMSLECGVVDPEETLKEMNEQLYAAGLQTIIDEKQAQLDKWAAENGVN